MGKDVITDQYGRFFELPEKLALLGHEVTCNVLKYQPSASISIDPWISPAGGNWTSHSLWPFPPSGFSTYYKQITRELVSRRPDVIVACSDAIHAIIGSHLARKHRIPLVIDLYDQYESYGATRLPGLKSAYRRALKQADLITCVSQRLCDWCVALGVEQDKVILLNNAVSAEFQTTLNKVECRAQFGLPEDPAVLIGTAGALCKNRDIQLLYDSFESLAEQHPDLHLVVAGPRDIPPPQHSRIHDLGILPHHRIPSLFTALDIGVVCNAESDFSLYCNPQKLLEMQACGLPVITANIVERNQSEASLQYQTGNVESLRKRIEMLLNRDAHKPVTQNAPSWVDRAKTLEAAVERIIQ